LAHAFVTLQVALSLVLLIASGLMIRSLQALYDIDLGYQRERVLVTWIFPVLAGYDHAKEMSLYREASEKLNAIPGVRSASLSRYRMSIGGAPRKVWVQSTDLSSDQGRKVHCAPIGPRFFETMGIGLLLGREFSPADSETSPKVAVVSEAMARNLFPNQNPIGIHLGFDGLRSSGDIQIVGVAKNIRRFDEELPLESVYIPYTQAPSAQLGQVNLLVRTAVNPATVIAAMRREIQSIDRNLPLVDLQTQAQEVDHHLGGQRSLATLLSSFGALALILTSIGLFGTMSYAVGRRTKELGIRMALGARKEDVLWMVLRQALWLVLVGTLIGIPLAAVATRLIATMLFSVTAGDPVTILCAIFGMFATATLAAYFPARRATRVDPLVALRYE
jgi:predicted permease